MMFCVEISYANENNGAELNQNNFPIINFEEPNTELGKIKSINTPKCDTPELFEKVMQRIKAYTSSLQSNSIINKRRNTLLVTNIEGFEEISVENFDPETDYHTANALITIKVNMHYKNKDITLCRQTGKNTHPLYLIMYPYLDNYKVHIINLDMHSDDHEKISFIYP